MKRYVSLFLILALVFTSVHATPVKAVEANASGKINLIQEGAYVGTQWEDARETQHLWSAQAPATAKETIYQGLISMDEAIDLSSYSMTFDELMSIIEELVNEAPELFYSGSSVRAYEDDDGYITRYIPDYLYSPDEVEAMQGELDVTVAELMAGIEDSWSDLEKALYVHDYLIRQFSYDKTYSKYSMYNLLVEGSAVCQGYTLTYIYIMKLLDIPCVAVPSDSMGHIWNQVQINGKWYHVDMTYDDPLPDIAGAVKHNNFLVSDTRIATQPNNEHSGWNSVYKCTDTTYDNYFWLNSHAPFVYGGGKWYYTNTRLDANAGIYEWEPATGVSREIVDLDNEKWYVDSDAYYMSLYSGLVCYEDVIYYNTADCIYYFSVDYPEQIQPLSIPTVKGNIWGIQFKDYELKYSVGTDYNQISGTPTGLIFEKPVTTAMPTIMPTPTQSPNETTAVPALTMAPGASPNPMTEATMTPQDILPVTPVPSSTLGVVITPPPQSVVPEATPEATMTPEEESVEADSMYEEEKTIAKSSIRITAKKGKRKIVVRVPKKVKSVIGLNKKLIRKKKKKVRKYKVSAKKNRTGKITLRLSGKLRKGMKIKVTIYTSQGRVSLTKIVK